MAYLNNIVKVITLVLKAKAALSEILEDPQPHALLDVLSDPQTAPFADLPDTGVGLATE
ncbi:hypothetical protein L0F63_004867, partial [Massospora cicadina]